MRFGAPRAESVSNALHALLLRRTEATLYARNRTHWLLSYKSVQAGGMLIAFLNVEIFYIYIS